MWNCAMTHKQDKTAIVRKQSNQLYYILFKDIEYISANLLIIATISKLDI